MKNISFGLSDVVPAVISDIKNVIFGILLILSWVKDEKEFSGSFINSSDAVAHCTLPAVVDVAHGAYLRDPP